MSLVQFNLNGGSDNTVITAANTGASSVSLGGGTGTFQSTSAYSGASGVRFTYTASSPNPVFARFAPLATGAILSSTFMLRCDTVGGQSIIIGTWRSSSAPLYTLRFVAVVGGVIRAKLFVGTTEMGDFGAVVVNQWYRATAVVNASTGVYSFKLYDGTTLGLVGVVAGTDATNFGGIVSYLQVGQSSVLASNVTVDIDDVRLDNGSASEIPVGSVSLQEINPQSVEPETIVALTAVLEGGGSANVYTWRQVSGPSVTLFGSDASRAFRAPSAMPPGTTVVIGVTATVGSATSPEVIATVDVLSQLSWVYDNGWIGRRPPVQL